MLYLSFFFSRSKYFKIKQHQKIYDSVSHFFLNINNIKVSYQILSQVFKRDSSVQLLWFMIYSNLTVNLGIVTTSTFVITFSLLGFPEFEYQQQRKQRTRYRLLEKMNTSFLFANVLMFSQLSTQIIVIIMIVIIIIIIIIMIIIRMCTASAYYGNVDAPAHQSPGWHLWQVPATP